MRPAVLPRLLISTDGRSSASQPAEQPRNPPLERDTASALREAKRYDEAEAVALRALELDPTAPESYTTIAGVLKEAKRLEESAAYMKGEAETDVTSRAAAASPPRGRRGLRPRPRRVSRRRRRAHTPAGHLLPPLVLWRAQRPGSWEWGPHAKERGIGGSESAVIALSRELVGAGWGVRVYGSPPAEDVGVDDHGVAWLPHWAYRTIKSGARGDGNADQTLDEGEVFVAWRFAEALHVGRHAARRCLWLHDEVQVHTVPRVCILAGEGRRRHLCAVGIPPLSAAAVRAPLRDHDFQWPREHRACGWAQPQRSLPLCVDANGRAAPPADDVASCARGCPKRVT